MKKVLIVLMLAVAALMMTGCADNMYGAGKAAYQVTEAGVRANSDLIDDGTLNKLKVVDGVATRYDTTRTIVKEAIGTKPDK